MALKVLGESGIEADVNADKALYVEPRAPSARGYYSCGIQAGGGGIGSNIGSTDNVMCFRWNDPNILCLLRRIVVSVAASQAGTIAGMIELAAYFARNFTVTPAANTTYKAYFGHDCHKLSSTFPSSKMTFMAAGPGNMGGTYTTDTNPLARMIHWMPANISNGSFSSPFPLIDRTGYGQYPITIAKNEGIVFMVPSLTVGGGNPAWFYTATFEWQEAYSY